MVLSVSLIGPLKKLLGLRAPKEPKSQDQEPRTLNGGKSLGRHQSQTSRTGVLFLVPLLSWQPPSSHSWFCFCSPLLCFTSSFPLNFLRLLVWRIMGCGHQFHRWSDVLGNLRQEEGREELRPGGGISEGSRKEKLWRQCPKKQGDSFPCYTSVLFSLAFFFFKQICYKLKGTQVKF